MLAFALPPKNFVTFQKKRKENTLQKSILNKISKALPRYTKSEIADVYLLARGARFVPANLDLSDEEKQFLGISDSKERVEQSEQVFLKAVNLGDYF